MIEIGGEESRSGWHVHCCKRTIIGTGEASSGPLGDEEVERSLIIQVLPRLSVSILARGVTVLSRHPGTRRLVLKA